MGAPSQEQMEGAQFKRPASGASRSTTGLWIRINRKLGEQPQAGRQEGSDAVSTTSERRNRAELSHREAMALLESERASRVAKTAKLRELRLAREAAERREDAGKAASRKSTWGGR
jgi:hypothetical protein